MRKEKEKMFRQFLEGLKILNRYSNGEEIVEANTGEIVLNIPRHPRFMNEGDVEKLEQMGFFYDEGLESWLYGC